MNTLHSQAPEVKVAALLEHILPMEMRLDCCLLVFVAFRVWNDLLVWKRCRFRYLIYNFRYLITPVLNILRF